MKLLINCILILNEVLKNLSPNKQKMLNLANSGYITATDLADYLVKNHGNLLEKLTKLQLLLLIMQKKRRKN